MERKLIPTGLHIELPEGFEAQIRPRSGLAFKHGIGIVNSPGTIDADYRGEVKVLLINFSDQSFEINTGDRIAQMVVARHETVSRRLQEVFEVFNETLRRCRWLWPYSGIGVKNYRSDENLKEFNNMKFNNGVAAIVCKLEK